MIPLCSTGWECEDGDGVHFCRKGGGEISVLVNRNARSCSHGPGKGCFHLFRTEALSGWCLSLQYLCWETFLEFGKQDWDPPLRVIYFDWHSLTFFPHQDLGTCKPSASLSTWRDIPRDARHSYCFTTFVTLELTCWTSVIFVSIWPMVFRDKGGLRSPNVRDLG